MSEMLRSIFRLVRPGGVILAVIFFFMGTGIADYLGSALDWQVFWVGEVFIVFLLLSGQFLENFFSLQESSVLSENNSTTPGKPTMPLHVFRRMILQIAISMLTICAVLTVLLLIKGTSGASLIMLVFCFIGIFISAVPPFHLTKQGYGALIESILLANLIPAFAFLLQNGEVHRLLIMITTPFTGFLLSMYLAFALTTYAQDIRLGYKNIMIRLGWERGMVLHNILILLSFAIIALASLFGLPWKLVWPVLISIPVGLYQIWQMRQIAAGLKPNWKMLKLTSMTLVGLSAYLITISLWIG